MGLIRKEVFICLDCESTGLDPKKDRIVEIAAVCFTFDAILESFETLIDPECPIPETSQDIHKISQEMVAGKPKIQEILPRILKMAEGRKTAMHPFNLRELRADIQSGKTWPKPWGPTHHAWTKQPLSELEKPK